MRKSLHRSLEANATRALGAVLAVSALIPDVALAQQVAPKPTDVQSEQAPQDSGLGDIIVTAQRRSQNLQDVPVTVSAISGDDLRSKQILSVTDLGSVAPGLQANKSTGATSIYLRGVGNNNSTAGQEQNVAIYVDGVYYPSISADLGSFQNVERIEVLKGPQGTLFGRNATGGLIQVITRDPQHETSGRLSGGYGNYDTATASGYLTTGLTSTLAADVAVNYQNQADGWGKNVNTGDDVYRMKTFGVRSKWLWEPAVGTKLTGIYGYTYTRQDLGDVTQLLSTTPIAAFGGDKNPGNIYDVTQNEPGTGSQTRQHSASLKFEQSLGTINLMALSAYQNTDRQSHLDLDHSAASVLVADFPDKSHSFSQELQLSSKGGSPFTWIAGLYYFSANGKEDPLNIQVGPTRLSAAAYDTGQKTQSISGYGQASYTIGGKTTVTAGGRYTYDHKELYGCLTALGATGYSTICANDATRKRAFKNFDYRLAIDHHLTDNLMVYASTSTGFKSGVYNITFSTPSDAPVRPEKLTSYEAGVKSELFDRRVRLNLSGFYYDYKDIQFQTFVGTAILLVNAAAAKIYGGEASVDVKVAEGLRLSAAGTLVHSQYENFRTAPSYDSSSGIGIPSAVDVSGNQLLRTPKATFNAGLDYRVPVSFGKLGSSVNFYHNSGFPFEPDNRLRQGSYNLVNGEISWTSLNDRYTIRAWAKNLGDTKYYMYKLSGRGAADAGAPGSPRTYGATLAVSF